MRKRIIVLSALGVVMLLGAACQASDPVVDKGWTTKTISEPGPIWDRRTPRQDLAWMGGNRVMAAWVTGSTTSGLIIDRSGPLYARFYNVDANWESDARLLQEDVTGVQSLATGPIDLGPCLIAGRSEASAIFASSLGDAFGGTGAGTSHTFRSFLAAYSSRETSSHLRVHRIDWCGGTIQSSVVQTIDSAKLGAMAGRRVCRAAGCSQEILVVYERAGLRGRFMNGSGAWTGPEFVIDEDIGERRYIDITWNPVSRRFFIGYNVIGDGFEECSIRQAAVAPSGKVHFVRVVNPVCDGGAGGHRSSSSTDDNLIRNPAGKYLWYFQAPNGGNKVHLVDSSGDVIATLDVGEGTILELPLPVALANLHEVSGASYAISVHFALGSVEPPYAFVTLSADGSVVSIKPVPKGETLAAEALATKVVTATGISCTPEETQAGVCQSWFISVYDQP